MIFFNLMIIFLSSIILIYTAGWATTIVFRTSIFQNIKLFDNKCVCDDCGAKVRNIYTVPIIGYLCLRGKTKCCSHKLTKTYTLIEAILIVSQIAILIFLRSSPELCAFLLFIEFAVISIFFTIKQNGIKIRFTNLVLGILFSVIPYLAVWFILFVDKILSNALAK
jgi:prepilin signal peptidase PulO-like enzyme (type II secretory pathway)